MPFQSKLGQLEDACRPARAKNWQQVQPTEFGLYRGAWGGHEGGRLGKRESGERADPKGNLYEHSSE